MFKHLKLLNVTATAVKVFTFLFSVNFLMHIFCCLNNPYGGLQIFHVCSAVTMCDALLMCILHTCILSTETRLDACGLE